MGVSNGSLKISFLPSQFIMACNIPPLALKISFSISSLCSSTASVPFPKTLTTTFPFRYPLGSTKPIRSASVSTTDIFTWDDVMRISQSETALDDPSDLKPYVDKIQTCNRGSVSYKFSQLPNTAFIRLFFLFLFPFFCLHFLNFQNAVQYLIF